MRRKKVKVNNPKNFIGMCYFFAGLTKFTDEKMNEILPLIPFDPDTNVDYIPLCPYFFECQCPPFVSYIFQNGCKSFAYFSVNDVEDFVHGYCLANSHSSSSWYLKIRTDTQLEMMLMGMKYAKPAPGMGGTIIYVWTYISSSALFKLGRHTKNLEVLEMDLEPNIRSQSGFFEGIPKYFPKLRNLSLLYEGSLKDYKGLIAVLPKLVSLTKLEISFTSEDRGIDYWHPFDQLKQSPSLKIFHVRIDNHSDDNLSLSVMRSISPLLNANRLETLFLSNVHVSLSSCSELARYLQGNSCSLNTIEFISSNITSIEAFGYLIHSVTASKCLRKLSISCRGIHQEHAGISFGEETGCS